MGVAGLVPVVYVLELDGKDRGLDGVEPAVYALNFMDVFLERTVVCEKTGPAGEIVVVRDNGAGVAVGAEVLARVEAEGAGQAEGAGLTPPEGREMGLGAVLEHGQAAAVANFLDAVDGGRLAVEMDGYDCFRPARKFLLDLVRVYVEIFVDVHEDGTGAGLGDGLGGRNPGVSHSDDLVAGADAERLERDVDGVGAVGAAYAVLDSVLGGVSSLEGIDVLPADEGGIVDDGLDGGVYLGLDGQVLGFQVDKRNIHGSVNLFLSFY